jgi:hypothetical protein
VTVCVLLIALHLMVSPVEIRTIVGVHAVPIALIVLVARTGPRDACRSATADVANATMRIAAAAAATTGRTVRVDMLYLPGRDIG